MSAAGQKRDASDIDSCTMDDLLAEQIQLEEEAKHNIKENWGDEGICTYVQGYMSQNLYACATCQGSEGNRDAFGFCYGCSMQCHLNHNIYELFNKRNFRCDCGLSKCGTCDLEPKADKPNNTENKYNQNFQGLYCFCNKPYNPETDEMLQCYVCQDWFHVECIESAPCNTPNLPDSTETCIPPIDDKTKQAEPILQFVPSEREDTNMICHVCMDKHPFLYKYTLQQCIPPGLTSLISKKQISGATESCRMPQIDTNSWPSFSAFWNFGWRSDLCRCEKCILLYQEHGVKFMIEEEEVLEEDESIDVPDGSVNLDNLGMATLSQQFPQEQQHDILRGFNVLAGELREYLAPLAQNGTTVTKEHIEEFFEKMNQKKRKLN